MPSTIRKCSENNILRNASVADLISFNIPTDRNERNFMSLSITFFLVQQFTLKPDFSWDTNLSKALFHEEKPTSTKASSCFALFPTSLLSKMTYLHIEQYTITFSIIKVPAILVQCFERIVY